MNGISILLRTYQTKRIDDPLLRMYNTIEVLCPVGVRDPTRQMPVAMGHIRRPTAKGRIRRLSGFQPFVPVVTYTSVLYTDKKNANLLFDKPLHTSVSPKEK